MLRELEAFNESPPKRRRLEARTNPQKAQPVENGSSHDDLPLPSDRGKSEYEKLQGMSLTLSSANAFLRQVFVLRSLLSQEQRCARDLANSLVSLFRSCTSIVTNSGSPLAHTRKRPRQSHGLSQLLHSKGEVSRGEKNSRSELQLISSSIMTLLDGLDHLKREDSGAAVCEFLKMFQATLLCIIQGPSGRTSQESKEPDPTQGKSRASLKQHPSIPHPSREEDRIHPLSRFSVQLLSSLDTTKTNHRDLLDGCMYYLLSEAGKLLDYYVFQDDVNCGRPPISRPTTRSATSTIDQFPSSLSPTAAANLIWILERATVLSSESTLAPKRPTQKGDLADPPSKAEWKMRLSSVLRTKVQNTLLRPLFKDQNATFADAFKEPDLSNLTASVPLCTIEPRDVSNWFKQEIWRIVGWDTIQEKIEWAD